jgi:4-amino-4-deoxychorismate lyase
MSAEYLLLESIRIVNGKPIRLSYHQQRMNDSILQLSGRQNTIDIKRELEIFPLPSSGIWKCRIVYTPGKIINIGCTPYVFNPIRKLYVIKAENLQYAHKFADRTELNKLSHPDPSTDILMVRQGKVTDTLYANVVCWDGTRWLTPAQPLLRGTMRQALLDQGIIHQADINIGELGLFKCLRRINALMEFNDPPLPTARIIW